MSHIPTAELADLTGYSKRQIQRFATAGQIPGAKRSVGGHWLIEDTPDVRRWIDCHRKVEMPGIPKEVSGSLSPEDTYQLAKEIHIKANSLRRALDRATWFQGHPIWTWVWQDIEPLRVTLESLCLPLDEALTFVQEQQEKRPIQRRPMLVKRSR